VLYALKRDARTEQIPVIVVSHLPPANFANLKVAGAAEYFHKLRFLEDDEGEAAFLGMINRVLRESRGAERGRKADGAGCPSPMTASQDREFPLFSAQQC